MILINHITSSLVLLSSRQDFTYLFFPVFQMVAVFSYLVLMRAIYPKSNRLILNHIAMLLSIGFVILTRLSLTRSMRQFMIVAMSLVIGLAVPVFMKQFKLIKRCELVFAAINTGGSACQRKVRKRLKAFLFSVRVKLSALGICENHLCALYCLHSCKGKTFLPYPDIGSACRGSCVDSRGL